MVVAAAIQMVSTQDIKENLATAAALIQQAVQQHATVIALPENFALFGASSQQLLANAEQEGNGQIQQFLQQQAKQHNIWLIGGTIPLLAVNNTKVYASCLVYNQHGQQVARYNKIHLFNADVDDETKHYRESDHIQAGETLASVTSPWGELGLSVCYDLRFPELYRRMAKQGATILFVPSAFTYVTGKAHWEILLKARAIENLCYVIAPNQGGIHAADRQTYGHSMIIAPWGDTLAQCQTGADITVAELDLEKLAVIRKKMPVLSHIKLI